MNGLTTGATRPGTPRSERASRLATLPSACPVFTAFAIATSLACASGPDPEYSGIPGFEPTVQTVSVGTNEHIFVIDSSDIVVASSDRTLLGGIYILLDDAQLPFRRYFQMLPPRTAVGLLVEATDSMAMDSVIRASRARVVAYEHVQVPRDNSGNPIPIARFLVASVRNKVARAWVVGTDSAANARPLPDWVVAGVTQLVTGYPSSSARTTQLQSQRADLIPLDSLTRMQIPESAVPAGVAGDGTFGGVQQGRLDSRGRPISAPAGRKLPTPSLAALEAAAIIEFMWAREGRGIIKQLVDRTRRGEPLSAVIAQAVSLPHDVAGLDSVWRASLTPPPKEKK